MFKRLKERILLFLFWKHHKCGVYYQGTHSVCLDKYKEF